MRKKVLALSFPLLLLGCSAPSEQQATGQEQSAATQSVPPLTGAPPATEQPSPPTNDLPAAEDLYIRPTVEVTGPLTVAVTAETNIPDGATLTASMGLANQAPDDVYIGTRGPQDGKAVVNNGKISAEINGAAIGDVPALPSGDYEVIVSFYPMWDENKVFASRLGLDASMGSEIQGKANVTLAGGGQSSDDAVLKAEGQRWVRLNIDGNSSWNEADLVERFGSYEEVPLTSDDWNPDVIHMYYFPKIDMTFMVNVPQNKIATWRVGRASE